MKQPRILGNGQPAEPIRATPRHHRSGSGNRLAWKGKGKQ